MQTECSASEIDFGRAGGRGVVADFDGGMVSSDAGAVLLGDPTRLFARIRSRQTRPYKIPLDNLDDDYHVSFMMIVVIKTFACPKLAPFRRDGRRFIRTMQGLSRSAQARGKPFRT
jgi:hypothetical protein